MHVLFVCGRGAWRSPTAARVFGRRPGLAVRARGLSRSARSKLGDADLRWAHLILVMEREQATRVRARLRELGLDTPLHSLDIPDEHHFMDPTLIALLEERAGPLLAVHDP